MRGRLVGGVGLLGGRRGLPPAEVEQQDGVQQAEDPSETERHCQGVGIGVLGGGFHQLQGGVLVVEHPLRLGQGHAGSARS